MCFVDNFIFLIPFDCWKVSTVFAVFHSKTLISLISELGHFEFLTGQIESCPVRNIEQIDVPSRNYLKIDSKVRFLNVLKKCMDRALSRQELVRGHVLGVESPTSSVRTISSHGLMELCWPPVGKKICCDFWICCDFFVEVGSARPPGSTLTSRSARQGVHWRPGVHAREYIGVQECTPGSTLTSRSARWSGVH